MYNNKKIEVIIPAAGIGKRMGNATVAKQFIEIGGKPILAHTIQKFQDADIIDSICICAAPDMLDFVRHKIVNEYSLTKVVRIVLGGKERQDSVYEGLKKSVGDMILVHDAVRPFIAESQINSLVMACDQFGAAALGVRPKDTIKMETDDGFIMQTLSRDQLWSIQTPQAFESQILRTAFESAIEDKFFGTDECMLVERIGKKIRIVEGVYSNIKITTSEDMISARQFLI